MSYKAVEMAIEMAEPENRLLRKVMAKREGTHAPNPLDLLRLAQEHVAAGWCQGAFLRPGDEPDAEVEDYETLPDSVCLIGGLMLAQRQLKASDSVYIRAKTAVESAVPSLEGAILWNDEHGRTKEEVLRVLDHAIEEVAKEYV